jgi:hypothetical protein
MLTTQSASGRWLEKKKIYIYITLYYIYGNPEQECKAAISGCQAYLFCRSMVFSGAMEHKKGPRKTISIYTDLKTVEIILLIEKGIHMDTPKSHRTMNNSLSSFSHIFPCQNHHFLGGTYLIPGLLVGALNTADRVRTKIHQAAQGNQSWGLAEVAMARVQCFSGFSSGHFGFVNWVWINTY